MELWVYGKGSLTNDELGQLVYWACDYLGISSYRKLSIRVDWIKNLNAKKGVYGWVWSNEDPVWVKYPRDFVIQIDPEIDYWEIMRVICHELVHVRQYAKAQLVSDVPNDMMHWKGQAYIPENYASKYYWDQPWEKEAHLLEKKMIEEYIAWSNSE